MARNRPDELGRRTTALARRRHQARRLTVTAPTTRRAVVFPLPTHPDPRRDWERLPAGRKARLTGRAGDLKGAALHVFTVCAEHADPRDGSNMRASLVQIADELAVDVRTVRAAMRQLETDHWLRCDHRSVGGMRAGQPNPRSTYTVLVLRERPERKLTKTQRRAHWPRWRRFPAVNGGRISDPTRVGRISDPACRADLKSGIVCTNPVPDPDPEAVIERAVAGEWVVTAGGRGALAS